MKEFILISSAGKRHRINTYYIYHYCRGDGPSSKNVYITMSNQDVYTIQFETEEDCMAGLLRLDRVLSVVDVFSKTDKKTPYTAI